MCFGTFFAVRSAENYSKMKKILLLTVTAWALAHSIQAQDKLWTMEECMEYAVKNSPAVKQKVYTHDTYKAEHTSAIANFLPSINGYSEAGYNFGRSIDPETNTYNNTTTFNNYYRVSGELILFNGGQLVNQWRQAKVNLKAGTNDIQKAKDDLAIKTMGAFVDVVYFSGTRKYAEEKLIESKRILHKTSREEELGLKGKADLVQIEAQVAEDDYYFINQQNLYNSALLTLKEYMNYPYDEPLVVDTYLPESSYMEMLESIEDIYNVATLVNPNAIQAELQLKIRKMDQLIQKGRLFPTITFTGGVSTSYFENLKSDAAPPSFRDQFKNNRGEWISFTINIPIFNRMNRVTEVRRARNNVRIAQEQKTEIMRQLQTSVEKAVQDREGYAKEAIQMEKKEKADAYAYQVTLRKYEEGLMSPIDLQTSANILLMSKANLLQRRLMYLVKCKEVEYYKGTPLINE